ncbi:MAG: Stk1 family PASTA domain-containing Ser/Thr kinase [Lachnospiraceae bacterium]|nr:Stk1 family PASTA domain-containing Ser/Thr kinase [Lachnospiraceae bacterium]
MLRIGMLLAERYEILQQIGSGGMAYVYRAKDHKLNRYVAIKVLKEEFCKDKAFVTKFRMEAQAAAGLSHTNVVGVYDVGELNSIYFIVMELVEGITLKEYINRKRKLGIKESIGVAIQVAQGLAAAHNRHLVHRDIKPQNIIISRDGKIKVADFGIARAITDETTNMYKAAGSVHYISPEQARGGYCDERSDIYSLGITMYEMVTGRVPFDGDTTVAVAIAHMNEAITPPSHYESSIPLALEQIILKCVQKRPERRYVSCEELIADLRQAIVTPQKGFVKFTGGAEDNAAEEADYSAVRGQGGQRASQDTIQMTPIQTRAKARPVREEQKAGTDFSNPSSRQERESAAAKSSSSAKERYPQRNQAGQVRRERPVQRQERPQNRRREAVREEGSALIDRIILGVGAVFGIVILIMVLYIAISLNGFFTAGSNVKQTLPNQIPQTTEEITEEETVTVWEPSEGETMSENLTEVPDVLGCSLQEAETRLKKAGLKMKVSSKYEYSDEYKAGTICRQQYDSGSVIEKDSSVTITISIGSDKFHLEGDQYINGNISVLKYALNSYSEIEVEWIGTESETYGKNVIINLEPKNADLAPGDKLVVYYSTGPSKVSVPELAGKSKEQAITALESVGLWLGAVTEQYHDTVESGVIISQNIGSGTTVKVGSSVDIVISIGKRTCEVPNVLSYSESDAKTALDAKKLVYECQYAYSDQNPAGTVMKQSVAAGTWVPEGTLITLTISQGQEPLTINTNVEGRLAVEVEAELTALSLNCSIAQEYSDYVEPGHAIRLILPNDGQGPVYRGSSVLIVVSIGPRETEPPATTPAPTDPPTTPAPTDPPTTPAPTDPPTTPVPTDPTTTPAPTDPTTTPVPNDPTTTLAPSDSAAPLAEETAAAAEEQAEQPAPLANDPDLSLGENPVADSAE